MSEEEGGRGSLTFGLLLEEFLAGAGAAGGLGVWHCLYYAILFLGGFVGTLEGRD